VRPQVPLVFQLLILQLEALVALTTQPEEPEQVELRQRAVMLELQILQAHEVVVEQVVF
jgi:hypothetical protein